MRPFINWAGSREKDLGVILPLIPNDIGTFVDPFVGDGACFLAAEAKSYALADKNLDLISAWRAVQSGGPRIKTLLPELMNIWREADNQFAEIQNALVELKHSVDDGLFGDYCKKMQAIIRIVDKIPYEELFPTQLSDPFEFTIELRHQAVNALEGMEDGLDDETIANAFYTAFKAAVFQYLVEVYNKPESKNLQKASLLIFLMEYARAGKFVVDAKEFRPEYGGARLNRRTIADRMDTIMSPAFAKKMEDTKVYNLELFRLLGYPFPKEEDSFLFMDVPTASPRTLSKSGHLRLAEFLASGTKARWMVIIPRDDVMREPLMKLHPSVVPFGKEVILMNY